MLEGWRMKHEQLYDRLLAYGQLLELEDELSRAGRPGRKARRRLQLQAQRAHWGGVDGMHVRAGEFRCLHCGALVSVDPLLSGVNNRNHCPYCLWSRHLDLHNPGDRLAACKGKMQPVGLSRKPGRNKYAPRRAGELLLVHLCAECGKVSLNRLAADDDPEHLEAVLRAASRLGNQARLKLALTGVSLLDEAELASVRAQLYGEL
jgi:DNA-directed RNA polymerase subunit RPC12/RpoP